MSATINEKSERVTKAVNSNNLIGNKDLEELYVGRKVTIDSQDVFVAGSAVTLAIIQRQIKHYLIFKKSKIF